MKSKKFFSLVFTLTIILTMTSPVFAQGSGTPYQGSSFQSTAFVVLPKVEVDIPTSAGMVIVNPYALQVDEYDSQIISDVQTLTNRTLVPLKVSVSVTGSTNGDATFSTTPVSGTATAKKVFLYLIFQQQSEPSDVSYADYDADNEKHLLVSSNTKKKTDFVTMNAASPDEPNYLSFQAFGNCAGNPNNDWTENDAVGMTLAFSFKMLPAS